ncbi:hypothetical protein HAV15_004720 [Penicillium sp. str. |nr:hypothetical protein HAV15_004720 [Penicillium sp. str. \
MTVVNDKMAVQGADKLQFELLDKSLNCPADDQREWWQRTGPLLASLMTSAGYTNESQRQHLMLFYTSVVPYLGPYPQKFPSAMTHNELPPGTQHQFSTSKLQQKNESIRELSQVAFGFDLKPDKISVKGYTFPGLKCHLTGKDMCSVVTESIQEYLGDADRYNTIGLMKEYIETTEARANFGFVYSHDCTTPEKSRHKVYGRTKDMSWNQVQEIWDFGGRIDSPESSKGLGYLQRLWELLEIGHGPHPLGLHLVWNYETKAGMKVPATKIYFPVYGLNDQKNVHAISQYLKEIGLDIHGNEYERAVRDLFPGFDIQQTDRLICWVSFAYTEKTGVYLSVYYHSSLEYPWLEKNP